MNLQEKIAKAQAQFAEIQPTVVNVEVGGELTVLTIRPIVGGEWQDIIATHPPRVGADGDETVGYNTDAVAVDYPVEAVTVDGETPSSEDWREMLSVLSAPNRTNIATILYKLNHLDPAIRLVEAGKAFKG